MLLLEVISGGAGPPVCECQGKGDRGVPDGQGHHGLDQTLPTGLCPLNAAQCSASAPSWLGLALSESGDACDFGPLRLPSLGLACCWTGPVCPESVTAFWLSAPHFKQQSEGVGLGGLFSQG